MATAAVIRRMGTMAITDIVVTPTTETLPMRILLAEIIPMGTSLLRAERERPHPEDPRRQRVATAAGSWRVEPEAVPKMERPHR